MTISRIPRIRRYFFLLSLLFTALCATAEPQLPPTDQRAAEIKTLNTPRTFPEIKTKAQWETRAKNIREQILVSAGLWPMPEKTPLNASVFDKIEHEDYTVEKVYFESLPGFFSFAATSTVPSPKTDSSEQNIPPFSTFMLGAVDEWRRRLRGCVCNLLGRENGCR